MIDSCGEQCGSAAAGEVVALKDAVGLVLAHDITEIVPGATKGPAFKKGHVVSEADIDHLARLGKQHLYVLSIAEHQMHENDAVARMAEALCGPGVEPAGPPAEGKINLIAAHDGLFDLDPERLKRFNMVPDVMCATIHRYTPVKKGHPLAGTRPIPLVIDREHVQAACALAAEEGGLLAVREMAPLKTGVVVTGNEVASGLIEDKFAPIVRKKVERLGGSVMGVRICPDDRVAVAAAIRSLVAAGAEMIITTAGMSVDPDDVTRLAIADAGGVELLYGTPVLPGAMFLTGRLKTPDGLIPILGVPACALFYASTALDVILPRVMAGQRFTREMIAELGHGGYCQACPGGCRFPICGFGRGC